MANAESSDPESRSDEPLYKRTTAMWRGMETASAVGGLALLGLLQIPWLDEPLDSIGIHNSERVQTGILVVVLTAVLHQLIHLARQQSKVAAQQREIMDILTSPEREGRRYFRDPMEAYLFLAPIASKVENQAFKRLDIIGVTLYGALPALSSWLNRPETVGWRVRLATFHDPTGRLAAWIPSSWSDEAKMNMKVARTTANSQELRQRGNEMEIYEYDFLPAVRGVRLGNGDLVISFMHWEPDGQASSPGLPYEYIPHNEETRGAESLRLMFDTWFGRALLSARQ